MSKYRKRSRFTDTHTHTSDVADYYTSGQLLRVPFNRRPYTKTAETHIGNI